MQLHIDCLEVITLAIAPIPMDFGGYRFRSTLEADWAATLTSLDVGWEYEPIAIDVNGEVKYLPDFRLPSQRVWAEVKGPLDEGIEKPRALQDELNRSVEDEWSFTRELVVILRPAGLHNTSMWEGTDKGQDIVMVLCPNCQHFGFMDFAADRRCRRYCKNKTKRFWTEPAGGIWWPEEMPFVRAPRPTRKGK